MRDSIFTPSRFCLLVAMTCWVTACGWEMKSRDHASPLVVMVASSMQDVFRELEYKFEALHPDVDVTLTVAGSQVLRLQIQEGANGDVFVSANRSHLDTLATSELVSDVHPFAQGALVLLVSSAADRAVQKFEDIILVDRIVLGTPAVPIGAYTEDLLQKIEAQYGAEFLQKLQEKIVSREHNVRLVRAKVLLGEADAAIVYRSDVPFDQKVRAIEIPPSLHIETTHWYAEIRTERPHPKRDAFLRFLRSPVAAGILSRHGFQAVP